ncbi:MAG: hypothetical protein AAGC96_15715, partial [Pseudomonadota bacterium]
MLRGLILKSTFALAAFAAAAFGTSFVAPASASGIGIYNSCEDPRVVRHIKKNFRILDRNVLEAGLSVDDIHSIRETGPVYTPVTEIQLIPRIFCQGTAAMSDGKSRTIYIMLEDGQGYAGFGDYVNYCISGLDP